MSASTSITEIDPQGDLIVDVIELDYDTFSANRSHPVLRVVAFKVSRDTLIANSTYFEGMLSSGFKESYSKHVTLQEDTVASMELWFRIFHGVLEQDSFTLPIKEVWEAIAAGRKYEFEIEKLQGWFETYWMSLDRPNLEFHDLRALMFPLQTFENASGFAYVTKRLAYEGFGHIEEFNPSRHKSLHVEGRVIQQLNSAKGSMRGVIIAGLFDPMDNFCRCNAKKESLWEYNEGIKRTSIWPLKKHHTRSNMEIVEGFGFVNWHCEIPASACSVCSLKLEGPHISEITMDIKKYWEGLCLCCMDISRPRNGNTDSDYWLHNQKMRWGVSCKIKHGRNTWYHSYMGRPEIMTKFMRDQQNRKQDARKQDARKQDARSETTRRYREELLRRSETKNKESI